MYKVTGTRIELTRGDTFRAKVTMSKDGVEYKPSDEDIVRFALKHKNMDVGKGRYTDRTPLITKVIPNDTQILHLEPSDTKKMEFGEYVYDIEITFESGDVDTFIDNATFVLAPEVD